MEGNGKFHDKWHRYRYNNTRTQRDMLSDSTVRGIQLKARLKLLLHFSPWASCFMSARSFDRCQLQPELMYSTAGSLFRVTSAPLPLPFPYVILFWPTILLHQTVSVFFLKLFGGYLCSCLYCSYICAYNTFIFVVITVKAPPNCATKLKELIRFSACKLLKQIFKKTGFHFSTNVSLSS